MPFRYTAPLGRVELRYGVQIMRRQRPYLSGWELPRRAESDAAEEACGQVQKPHIAVVTGLRVHMGPMTSM